MQEIAQALGSYMAGSSTREELCEAVRQLVQRSPERKSEAFEWLKASVDSGRVSQSIWECLHEIFAPPANRTVIRGAVPEAAAASLGTPGVGTPGGAALPGGALPGSTTWLASSAQDPVSPLLSVGSVLKNRFTLLQELGRGGMGQVFKATDQRRVDARDRNPFIALKVLSEEFARHADSYTALQREAKRAQELAHPCVIKVFDFDRDGPIVFMTMEYLEGETLDQWLSSSPNRRRSVAEVWSVIESVGSALSAAHENHIVHSDLKPSNIFMCGQGRIKVLDFGISRPVGITGSIATKTLFDPAERLGALTPAYASVEQLRGGSPDPRDDIYAFACVVYELLTGEHPFAKVAADKAQKSGLVPRRISGISRRQWDAMKRGLAFDRSARTGSIKEFVQGLATLSRLRKYRLYVAAAAAALLIVVIMAAARMYRDYWEDRFLGQRPRPAAQHIVLSEAQRKEVADSLFLAQDYLQDAKLSASPDELAYILSEGANNVNQILDSILATDPANDKAYEMKTAIAKLYWQKAQQLMAAHQPEDAAAMIRYGRKIAPDNRDLYRMQQDMCDDKPDSCAAGNSN